MSERQAQTSHVPVTAGEAVALPGIDLSTATVARDGEALRITLPDGRVIVLDGFVAAAESPLPPMLALDGGTISGAELIAALDGGGLAAIVPAAGSGARPSGGAAFRPHEPGDIGDGLHMRALLSGTELDFRAVSLEPGPADAEEEQPALGLPAQDLPGAPDPEPDPDPDPEPDPEPDPDPDPEPDPEPDPDPDPDPEPQADPPVPEDDAGAVREDVVLGDSGNLLANDAGEGLAVANPGSHALTYGILVLAADGNWTYELDNAAAQVQALSHGQTVSDSFAYSVANEGGSATANLNIAITGTNDAALVEADKTVWVPDDNAGGPFALQIVAPTDIDAADLLVVRVTGTPEHGSLFYLDGEGQQVTVAEGDALTPEQLSALRYLADSANTQSHPITGQPVPVADCGTFSYVVEEWYDGALVNATSRDLEIRSVVQQPATSLSNGFGVRSPLTSGRTIGFDIVIDEGAANTLAAGGTIAFTALTDHSDPSGAVQGQGHGNGDQEVRFAVTVEGWLGGEWGTYSFVVADYASQWSPTTLATDNQGQISPTGINPVSAAFITDLDTARQILGDIRGTDYGSHTLADFLGENTIAEGSVWTFTFVDSVPGSDQARHGSIVMDFHLPGEDGLLIVGGPGTDLIYGGDGDDWLEGGPGDDTLLGGAGDDTLLGRQGKDDLTGGEGADTFRFGWEAWGDLLASPANFDMVRDYDVTEGDRIDLSELLAADAGFDIADFVRVEGNVLYVDPDGQVAEEGVKVAEFDGGDFSQVQVVVDGATFYVAPDTMA